MAKDKLKEIEDYFGPQYDSDEDLPEETREKIKKSYPTQAEKLRNEAWDKSEMYPKLKRVVKGAWYGDKRKPKE